MTHRAIKNTVAALARDVAGEPGRPVIAYVGLSRG
jgi:hypothetical protein